MDYGPDIIDETTRAALPLNGRRDAWLEQRLGYLIGEQTRLKGGVPLRQVWVELQRLVDIRAGRRVSVLLLAPTAFAALSRENRRASRARA